jgi:hypothetical protein
MASAVTQSVRTFGGPTTNRAILDVLRELVAEARGLSAGQAAMLALLERGQSSTLSRSDRAILARLLPPIGGVFGSELFAVREIFESESPALTVALRGLNLKPVGRLLRRAIDQPVDGYVVQREGTELHAALWRVVKIAGFPRNNRTKSKRQGVWPLHQGEVPVAGLIERPRTRPAVARYAPSRRCPGR